MGGTKYTGYKKMKKDHRVVSTNEKIINAIIALASEHLDEFPFSARETIRKIGRDASHTTITREREGLKGWYVHERQEFTSELSHLVTAEQQNSGKISTSFCQKLGLLIISRRVLFALDVTTRSFRNTEYLVKTLAPLINDKILENFGVELYQLLQEWNKEQFSHESLWIRYNKHLIALFHQYQIARPSMGLFSKSSPNTLPATGSIFDEKKLNQETS